VVKTWVTLHFVEGKMARLEEIISFRCVFGHYYHYQAVDTAQSFKTVVE
jgi:hypothetical protein